MANYYIDYENVHNEGLKGVYQLQQGDKLTLFYSSKADTLKIDVVRQLMDCSAEIQFEKIVNGVENALDFQLITALMCNYVPEERYYIISRDKGYDAAIEMAAKQNRSNVYRCRDIDGAIKHYSGLGIDENDHDIIVDLQMDTEEPEAVAEVIEDAAADFEHEADLGITANDPVLELVPDKEQEMPEPEPQEKELSEESKAEAGKKQEAKSQKAESPKAESKKAESPKVESPKAESKKTESPKAESQEIESQEEAKPQENTAEEPNVHELERRAYQSMCTKIMNNIKLVHKIPLNYKQAGEIYEALMDSDSKMQFYHRLLQSMGRKKGGELYQKIKAVYKPVRALYLATMESGDQEDAQPDVEAKAVQAVENVETVKAAFEQAEQLQGNPGEAILKMVDLVKKK